MILYGILGKGILSENGSRKAKDENQKETGEMGCFLCLDFSWPPLPLALSMLVPFFLFQKKKLKEGENTSFQCRESCLGFFAQVHAMPTDTCLELISNSQRKALIKPSFAGQTPSSTFPLTGVTLPMSSEVP